MRLIAPPFTSPSTSSVRNPASAPEGASAIGSAGRSPIISTTSVVMTVIARASAPSDGASTITTSNCARSVARSGERASVASARLGLGIVLPRGST